MNHRFGNRVTRLGLILFAAGGLTALGCSLIVEFDESKIPSEDTGVVAETSVDAPLPDTQMPDTTMPDTQMPDTTMPTDTADSAAPTDTADSAMATDTADSAMATDTADSAVMDTEMPDTADTAPMDTEMPDTADTAPADTEMPDTADTAATDTADAAVTLFFSTVLSGAQENPPVTTTATGTAQCTVTITTTNSLICTLTHDAASASDAHIHGPAPFGVNAGVKWGFSAGTTGATLTQMLSAAELDELRAGKYYVNVHTTAHSGGEIRGQLIPKGATFYAGRFTNASGTDAGGATSGGGFGAFYTATDTMVTYFGTVTGLSGAPTDAHVHQASGVIFGLTPQGALGTTTTYAGTASGTDASTFFARAEAMDAYANVHTAAVPLGEARADLVKIFVAP